MKYVILKKEKLPKGTLKDVDCNSIRYTIRIKGIEKKLCILAPGFNELSGNFIRKEIEKVFWD